VKLALKELKVLKGFKVLLDQMATKVPKGLKVLKVTKVDKDQRVMQL
jgi:hypothetical protein